MRENNENESIERMESIDKFNEKVEKGGVGGEKGSEKVEKGVEKSVKKIQKVIENTTLLNRAAFWLSRDNSNMGLGSSLSLGGGRDSGSQGGGSVGGSARESGR